MENGIKGNRWLQVLKLLAEIQISTDKHLSLCGDKVQAFIDGYMDYLNEYRQDELMLLVYYLEDYFEDCDHKILYFVLERLFDMGNDLRGDEYSDKFIFPNQKKIDDSLPSSQKAAIAIKYYYEIQDLYPDTINNEEINNANYCIQRFGMVLWSKGYF